MAKREQMALGDWTAKRFEANQLFTPSTPINVASLFAGRHQQLMRIVDAIGERGRHVIMFGERGVGKTSLAQIIPFLIPADRQRIRFCRIQCFPNDIFTTLARRVFREIRFQADLGEGIQTFDVSDLYPNDVTPDDFVRELAIYNDNDIPIIVIDEFNEISSHDVAVAIANTIKALSDTGAVATLVIVGVADNVRELIASHESIERCTEEVLMPRMGNDELRDIIEKRLSQLGMSIAGDAKWKIINLSKGLPQYVHGLGKQACFSAIASKRLSISTEDADAAIDNLLASSEQTFKDAYDVATRSNQPENLFRQVLTACALAPADADGYFAPISVREPLSGILGRAIQIANFQNHLKEFIEEKRGRILQRIGEERAFRFRFRHPAMQPYVIMRGIKDNIVDEKAKRALSYPEQPNLFPTDS